MNKKIKILIVDDEPDIIEILSYNLVSEGYSVITANNGQKAIKKAKNEKPELIILDVMMPEMDGIEACEKMRKIPELEETIITFLTARSEDYSLVAGLEAGADDYISKPIKPKVLISKVKSLLRRKISDQSKIKDELIQLKGLIIDKELYKIIYRGKDVILPRKEFELLCLLASKPGKVFKRKEILNKIWGEDVIVGGRTIDVHIRKLRSKLGNDKLTTLKGVGYKFND